MIAKAEWNDYTFEDVDRWDRERVQYYLARMSALADEERILSDEYAEEYRDEHGFDEMDSDLQDVESDAFDDLPPEARKHLPDNAKQRTGSGTGSSGGYHEASRPENISEDEYAQIPSRMKARSQQKGGSLMIPESYREKYMTDDADADADTNTNTDAEADSGA